MMELTLAGIVVAVLLATKWEAVSRWRMGLSGVLSLALGLRVAVLMAATYLVPCFAAELLAEQPAAESTEENPQLEADPKVAPASETALAGTGSKGAGAKANVQPSAGEKTTTADSDNALKADRTPVPIVTNVAYITPNRPAWLEAGPILEGEEYWVAVRGGPYRKLRDCENDLQKEIQLAVADYTNDYLDAPHASKFINYSVKDLRSRKVIQDQFSEQLETSIGLMNQVHARLAFNDQFREELDNRWAEIRSKSRLAQTGLGTGIVLLFLGTLFSYLKLDTATKGYYTGRLQFVASATILALVAASVLLMKWIPWM